MSVINILLHCDYCDRNPNPNPNPDRLLYPDRDMYIHIEGSSICVTSLEELKACMEDNYFVQVSCNRYCCETRLRDFMVTAYSHEDLTVESLFRYQTKSIYMIHNIKYARNYGRFSMTDNKIYKYFHTNKYELITNEEFLVQVKNGSILLVNDDEFREFYKKITNGKSAPLKYIKGCTGADKVFIGRCDRVYDYFTFDELKTKAAIRNK